jgi:hypothetical protein
MIRTALEELSFRNDFAMDISGIMPGVYLLKLYNGYNLGLQIKKIIKQ